MLQLLNSITLTESCRVKDVSTNKFTRCKFPFKFKGEMHNGCIDYIDVKNGQKIPGDPWCSTKVVGSNREHVSGGGHYGECNSSCPGVDNGSNETQLSLSKGNNTGSQWS